jgi:hypothetical protein
LEQNGTNSAKTHYALWCKPAESSGFKEVDHQKKNMKKH